MGLDISDIVTAFGAKYTDEGQLMKDIKKQLFHPSRADSFFTRIPTKNDIYKGGYASVNGALQAWVKNFNAKGDAAFAPTSIEQGEFKIDASMFPDDVRNSYLGFLAQLDKKDRTKWDIVSYWLMELLIPKANEEYETDVVWRGWKYDGTFAGTPTVNGSTFQRQLTSADAALPANATMDGIWLQLLKNLSRLNVITSGAIEAADVDFCTQVEDFAMSIPAPLRAQIDFLFMSEDLRNKYRRGRRAKYNVNWGQEDDLLAIDNTNIKVNWLRGMDNSEKIWGTPEVNRVRPTHVDNTGKFDVQKDKRQVHALTDWKKAIGFEVPEFVVTNDLENSITAQNITDYYTES